MIFPYIIVELVCWRAPEVRAKRGRGRDGRVGRKEEKWETGWVRVSGHAKRESGGGILNPPSSRANEITPSPPNPLAPLQYHHSDSAAAHFFSFLFIPIALPSPLGVVPEPPVLRSNASGRGKQPEVPHLSVIFHSPRLPAAPSSASRPPCLLCFLPTCLPLLMALLQSH